LRARIEGTYPDTVLIVETADSLGRPVAFDFGLWDGEFQDAENPVDPRTFALYLMTSVAEELARP
jgi:hypothetical protein